MMIDDSLNVRPNRQAMAFILLLPYTEQKYCDSDYPTLSSCFSDNILTCIFY